MSPSVISRQLAVLERQFGTRLLDRSSAGMALTHAGRMVDRFARTMLLDYDTLRADIDDLRGIGRAQIRIAAIESVTSAPLTALEMFREKFPNVTFRILTLTASQVEQAVREGLCDMGITLSTSPDPELRVVCEIGEPLVLAVAPGHALAGRRSIAMKDLADVALAVHESDHGVRRLVDLASRTHGFAVNPVLSSSSLAVLKDFARRGMGGAIITRGGGGATAARGQLVLVAIDEPVLGSGRIALLVRSDRRLSRALRLFTEAVAQILRDRDRIIP